ncbi:MAG: hypothetical protein EXR63_01390 [Dehalococcoidia bacterium]|nr:hypothetical protein [Dehalococcoidia bacterium]
MWRGIRQPWWLAFTLTWVVVAAALVARGMSSTSAARIALLAAALVAAVVWLALRNRFARAADSTDPPDARDR